MENKTIERYNIITKYLNNQTDEQWQNMLKEIETHNIHTNLSQCDYCKQHMPSNYIKTHQKQFCEIAQQAHEYNSR